MKLSKIIMMVCLLIALLVIGGTVSLAAYSAGNKTVQSGEEFSITVTSSTALEAYNLDLSKYSGLQFLQSSKQEEGAIIEINGGSIGYINVNGSTKTLGTYRFKAPTVTKDSKYTVEFLVDQSTTVKATITVKAPVVEPEPEPEPQPDPETPAEPSTPPATPTKSSNANLSNLGITPNDFTGFRAGTTSYSVSVPNDVTTIEVYAKKGHSAQTITGTGTKSLSEGSNVFPVVVTAEDGTKKTYQITVIRLAKEESNNPDAENNPVEEVALASLEIENVTLNEAFSPDILEYTAKADAEAEKVVVRATANVESAKVEVTGAEEYTPGENIIRVTVTSENGEDSKTYVIRVQKEETQEVLGTTDNDNTIPVVAGVTDNGSNDGNGGIGTTKLLFCIGIGVVALLGIVFAVIRYNKDKKEVTNELEPIDFASTFNPKEAVKDVVSATSKLSSMDSEPITENDGATKKNKGRHF